MYYRNVNGNYLRTYLRAKTNYQFYKNTKNSLDIILLKNYIMLLKHRHKTYHKMMCNAF